jgi:hypothetical protein
MDGSVGNTPMRTHEPRAAIAQTLEKTDSNPSPDYCSVNFTASAPSSTSNWLRGVPQ